MKIEQFDEAYALIENLKNVNYYIKLIESDGIQIGSCNKEIPISNEVGNVVKQIALDELKMQKLTLENKIEAI